MSRHDRLADYPKRKGAAALGARLRRLSERIDREADGVYAALGIDFEQRWYGVFNQLNLAGPRSVGELAETLGLSHPAISQICSALKDRGLIEAEADTSDARRRILRLTEEGARIAKRLASTWRALESAAEQLDREVGGLVRSIDRLEAALDKASLIARTKQQKNES